jgi:hypothetical protein
MTFSNNGSAVLPRCIQKRVLDTKRTLEPTLKRHITLRGDHNNNKMERMNGEIRDREKTMRGLKTDTTTILQGYQLFHNYIRPHETAKPQAKHTE